MLAQWFASHAPRSACVLQCRLFVLYLAECAARLNARASTTAAAALAELFRFVARAGGLAAARTDEMMPTDQRTGMGGIARHLSTPHVTGLA